MWERLCESSNPNQNVNRRYVDDFVSWAAQVFAVTSWEGGGWTSKWITVTLIVSFWRENEPAFIRLPRSQPRPWK